jgi:hypothetical protein
VGVVETMLVMKLQPLPADAYTLLLLAAGLSHMLLIATELNG